MKNSIIKKFKVSLCCVMTCIMTVGISNATVKNKVSAKPAAPNFQLVSGMQMISQGVLVSTGDYVKVNMGLIVSGNEAVVIDTGLMPELIPGYAADEALRVKQYIEQNNLTLKYVIITHDHIDHTGNLSMFLNENIPVYDPTNTLDGQILTLGDKTFKAIRTEGHDLDAHMSIELVKENILFAGDVVTTNLPTAVAFQGNYKNLIPTLEMLRTKNYSIIVPGHGDIIEPHEAIRMDIQYLKNVEKYVTRVINEGGSLEEALNISLEDCIKDTRFMDMENAPEVHKMNIETAYYEFLNK